MRIPRALAWILIAMALFTAGLLRQFHDLTPTSPFLAPAVGSLLFACVLFLVLVAVRERQVGAAPGPGIRLGSLTPLLLMLLFEKWVSSSFYQPLFALLAPASLSHDETDAWFRLLCGAGLLGIVAAVWRFSRPATAWVRRRLLGSRPVEGLAAALVAIAGASAVAATLAAVLGTSLSVVAPGTPGPLPVILAGQATIALAEETYYRGFVFGEILRLAPRLGLHAPGARRWVALAATSLLFGMEHLGFAAGWDDAARQLVFALALGTLLGMLVLLTSNIWFAAAMHAWINWLLLQAAPRIAYGPSEAVLPAGTAVSLSLIGAFVVAFFMQRRRNQDPTAASTSS